MQPTATKRTVGSQVRILGGVAGAPREGGAGLPGFLRSLTTPPEDVSTIAPTRQPATCTPGDLLTVYAPVTHRLHSAPKEGFAPYAVTEFIAIEGVLAAPGGDLRAEARPPKKGTWHRF
ncbi:hypothetical protein BKA03_000442 [Demequina lutea]|uniref:Uncharacterized protein n=1 Tax=Demequina lutea TaxID=431489 RepID=A0A7Y9Z975_9MICO|nr:hypothetical protein [Demequina lutea]